MRNAHRQLGFGLRFEWGLAGAKALARPGGCLVVVDVLSFTTTVSVAVSRGMSILPYAWSDATASEFARNNNAELAVGRSEVSVGTPWSLSAAALEKAPFTARLVLPSPNGSTIAAASRGLVVASSLRNGSEVAKRLMLAGFGTAMHPITVIAAGERWSTDDSLRPSIEDLLGAGQVLSQMSVAGCAASPEAAVAARSFDNVDVSETVRNCSSGRELIEEGYSADVEVAVQINHDAIVPALRNGVFTDFGVTDLLIGPESVS